LRITNSVLAKEALSGFQAQMRALDQARREATTGIRVSRPSDDPVAVAGIMRSASGLRALEQYQRNLGAAQSRLEVEDSALGELTDVLTRAKELAISQASDNASASTRETTAKEILTLVDFVTDLANTQVSGSYIFGGQYADSPPFQGGASDQDRPPSGSFQVEVGTSQFVDTNHSAQEIFIDSDVVDSLRDLATALQADDSVAIQATIPRLDSAFDEVQNLVGDLGARMNLLEVASSNLDSLEVNLQTFRSSLEDADLTEAVTRLVERQGALEAAMLANSKILNLTITDYLR
jgi:flagellar hook-associated protein 3 FlgL